MPLSVFYDLIGKMLLAEMHGMDNCTMTEARVDSIIELSPSKETLAPFVFSLQMHHDMLNVKSDSAYLSDVNWLNSFNDSICLRRQRAHVFTIKCDAILHLAHLPCQRKTNEGES